MVVINQRVKQSIADIKGILKADYISEQTILEVALDNELKRLVENGVD